MVLTSCFPAVPKNTFNVTQYRTQQTSVTSPKSVCSTSVGCAAKAESSLILWEQLAALLCIEQANVRNHSPATFTVHFGYSGWLATSRDELARDNTASFVCRLLAIYVTYLCARMFESCPWLFIRSQMLLICLTRPRCLASAFTVSSQGCPQEPSLSEHVHNLQLSFVTGVSLRRMLG